MANFTEVRAFLDKAEEAWRQRGDYRQKLDAAHRYLSNLEGMLPANTSSKVKAEIGKLRCALMLD